jgi:hypothetical protein
MQMSYAQNGFHAIWAFEKVFNPLSLRNKSKKAKLKFFKCPYFGKPFLVVRH